MSHIIYILYQICIHLFITNTVIHVLFTREMYVYTIGDDDVVHAYNKYNNIYIFIRNS